MPANGSAEWKGDLKSGAGTFTAGDTIAGDFSFRSRFEDGPGANPEQLIAAAHASCFSMALSAALADAGTPVNSVKTDAVVTLRFVDGAPTITSIKLTTVGGVPGGCRGRQGRMPGEPGAGGRSGHHPGGVAALNG